MKIFLQKWWQPFFTVPLITFIFFSFGYFCVYPFLTYDTWPIQANSIKAIQLIAIVGIFILSWMHSKVTRTRLSATLGFWAFFTCLGLLTDNGRYEGNINSGTVIYLFGFQFLAMLTTAIFSSYQRKMGSV